MKAASIVLRVLVTLALGAVLWGFASGSSFITPAWLTAPILAFLVTAWAVIFVRLRSPLAGLWALVVLLAVVLAFMLCIAGLSLGFGAGTMPDWALVPVLSGIIAAWLLLLRIRISNPWEAAKRVAHALVWICLSLLAAAIPAWVYSAVTGDSVPVLSAVVLAVLLVGAVALSYLAIRYRWSLTWPILVLFVLTWPFGVFVPIIVGLIGLGKLIVYAVGRGGTLAASELSAPVLDAHPRGLVESANYE